MSRKVVRLGFTHPQLPWMDPCVVRGRRCGPRHRGAFVEVWESVLAALNWTVKWVEVSSYGDCRGFAQSAHCSGLVEAVRTGSVDASAQALFMDEDRGRHVAFGPAVMAQQTGFYFPSRLLLHPPASVAGYARGLLLFDAQFFLCLLACLLLTCVVVRTFRRAIHRQQLHTSGAQLDALELRDLGRRTRIPLLLSWALLVGNYSARFTGNVVAPRQVAPFGNLSELEERVVEGALSLAAIDEGYLHYALADHPRLLERVGDFVVESDPKRLARLFCEREGLVGLGDVSLTRDLPAQDQDLCQLHARLSPDFPPIQVAFMFHNASTELYRRLQAGLLTAFQTENFERLVYRRYLFEPPRKRPFSVLLDGFEGDSPPVLSRTDFTVFLVGGAFGIGAAILCSVEDRRWSRLKLEYEEMPSSPGKDSEALWTRILPAASSSSPPSSSEVADAVRAGVPRHLRGRVWTLLSHLHAQSQPPSDPPVPPYSYPELLKGLTPHQHAILVDLGRTFPAHAYFQRQLGPGQVALYNLLKAYSLLDVEVGYCQGLSFVAGVLLLHMEEAEAFDALVTLMFRFRLRRHYLPDMSALQTEMYQFSRLLHDRAPLVHAHLERHEIPLLYAAPWFLTLFASTFPLGFVARVFDFLFLRGSTELVFAVGLRLMSEHAELIRHCDSFEAINDFLKTTLPPMSIIQMERIFNGVWETRLGAELAAFEVEYSLLEEEAAVGSAGAELAGGGSGDTSEADDESQDDGSAAELRVLNSSLQRHNQQLEQQLAELQAQLAEANETIGDLRSQLASLPTNPRLNGIVRDKKH